MKLTEVIPVECGEFLVLPCKICGQPTAVGSDKVKSVICGDCVQANMQAFRREEKEAEHKKRDKEKGLSFRQGKKEKGIPDD